MPNNTATINLLPKQTEAWNIYESKEITELGYGGAGGGGKTRLGCYLALAISEQYPGARGAIGRKELKTLRLTTLSEMFIIFAELGYKEGKDYVFKAQDNILKFANSSEILLLDTAYSPQDPEYTRFGSLNLTWGWVEESNETPEKGKSILKTRVGRYNTINGVEIKPFWLETFNPNKGHVYRDYYKPWKENKMPPYRAFVRALPGDNPHLPEAYIKNLERADKITKQRLLLGNFEYDSDERKLMTYDSIMDLTTNTVENSTQRYLINDIARFGGDKIVLGEWESLTLVGLSVYKFQDIEITKDKIKEQITESKIPYSQTLSDEDGVGGGVIDGLKGTKGFMGGSSPLEIQDTFKLKKVVSNFINLRSQCYFKLSEMVNNHLIAIKLRYFKTNIEGYTEDKAISDLQEELDQIKQADNTGQNTKFAIIPKTEIKEMLGRSPDYADIMMMRMLFQLKEEMKVTIKPYQSTTAPVKRGTGLRGI
jgi:hypothetical protein